MKNWKGKHRDDCREIWKCRTFLYHDVTPEVDELTSHDINMKLIANRLMPKRHFMEIAESPFFRSFDMSGILFGVEWNYLLTFNTYFKIVHNYIDTSR